MNFKEIVDKLNTSNEKIIVIYGFNATGKTSLSVSFKDATKVNGRHTGVYYNAFSEDLFVWDNDTNNDDPDIRLTIKRSSLNDHHSLLTEENIYKKLESYNTKYNFKLDMHENSENGIKSIRFNTQENNGKSIKISRSEERIFVWCFYLALFEVEGLADKQDAYFFIDDPVSSLDDHNIFATVATLYDLIEKHFNNRKIIITTHHIGLFSILFDWLKKGAKAERYKDKIKFHILKNEDGNITLGEHKKNVFLYHLQLLQTLDAAQQQNQLYNYHFVLLRQVLENIASFLGNGRISYVLEQIRISDTNETTKILNTLSHKNRYYFEPATMNTDSKEMFEQIFDALKDKYQFELHTEKP